MGVLTPVYVEKATGDNMAPQLEEAHGGVSTDTRLSEYVTWVGRKLVPTSLRPEFPRTFKVLDSKSIINAFAIGNGNVYVTRGTLNLLDDEAELAEVLGHENGHIGHRHIGQQIDRSVGIGSLLLLANGVYLYKKGDNISQDQQELITKANEVVPALVINGFGRAAELEADQHGLRTMVDAGYDPMGGVRVFQKFQKLAPDVQGLEAYFQSHPNASQRISELTSSIKSQYPGVTGNAFRDRYQSIVKGGKSLSSQTGEAIPGIPNEVWYIGVPVMATGVILAAVL